MTNQTPSLKWLPAKWTVHEDDDRLTLQIELGNDSALTLTIHQNGSTNAIAVWTGSGEHSFVDNEIADNFKQWLNEAADGINPVSPPLAPSDRQRKSIF